MVTYKQSVVEELYSQGVRERGPTKGIRLISSRVTKLSQRYNKNTCLTSVKHSFISNKTVLTSSTSLVVVVFLINGGIFSEQKRLTSRIPQRDLLSHGQYKTPQLCYSSKTEIMPRNPESCGGGEKVKICLTSILNHPISRNSS